MKGTLAAFTNIQNTGGGPERVFAVAVQFPEDSDELVESSFEELKRLVETLGGTIVDQVRQKRKKPDTALYIGAGKAEEVGQAARALNCNLVAFDTELSGTQQRNLERLLGLRVVDRTGVILDIFSRHARTKEAQNQVELASLEYLQTHLTRKWTHLERQKGGIGLKGVGEKQIELDRRMIRTRISRLKDDLAHSAKERAVQRLHRDKFLRVALVGYTNVGKSTLLNKLTDSAIYVDDRLFATLDSTVRALDPKTRPPVLLSDTVGFIRRLPHNLVASFRSTLQEVIEADLLLHVVDVSSKLFDEEMKVTRTVLEEIGAGDKPSFLVFNKADRMKQVLLPKILERRYVDSLVVSANRPDDMRRLREAIYSYFEREMVDLAVTIPYADTWLQSQIHEYARVVKTDFLDAGACFRIRIMRSTANWLRLYEKAKVETLGETTT